MSVYIVFDHKVMRQPAHVSTIVAICASPSIEKAGPTAPTRYTQRAQGVRGPMIGPVELEVALRNNDDVLNGIPSDCY